MNITEQQSREAFEKFEGCSIEARQGNGYNNIYTNDQWRAWQAALKFAEEQRNQPEPFGIPQETVILPKPPQGFHLATDEERKCLPEGSLVREISSSQWVPSGRIGLPAATHNDYACPDAPALVTFTDGKLNPPPFGQWHRDDFSPEMLAGGWRPLMDGEKPCGDQYLSRGKWWPLLSYVESHAGCLHRRTKRPLPASPAEEWVPLTAEDIPPGSVVRPDIHDEHCWNLVESTTMTGVIVSWWGDDAKPSLRHFTFGQLFGGGVIKRPGQDWQPCKKLKTSTP